MFAGLLFLPSKAVAQNAQVPTLSQALAPKPNREPAQNASVPTTANAISKAPEAKNSPTSAALGRGSKMGGILIDADSMERDSVNEIMELAGHVQVVYQGQHMKADRAKVNLRSRHVELYGHVEVITPSSTIGGEQIMLDYETNTGLIYQGFVQSGTVIFEGELLEKIGEDEYFVSDANYTACTNCPASWSFSGNTIRAKMGGYAYIKNSILRFGTVPVFWFPYLVVPLKSDRQSGLLTPDFENSDRGGLAISQPYFWAIDRNQDATFTLKNYDLRGSKYLFEHRYIPNDNSFSNLTGAMIRDRVFKDEERVNNFRPEQRGQPINRWFVRYDQYYELPGEVIQRADLNIASDLQYAKDFPLEPLNHGDSVMENKMSLTKNTSDQHYSVEADYYVNMLHSDPLSGNDDAVHRLPELRFSQTPKEIGTSEWSYAMDLDYVNFARSGPGYDELTDIQNLGGVNYRGVRNSCPYNPNDTLLNYDKNPACYRTYTGNFDSSRDLIRAGQRLDFQPSIYRTFRLVEGLDIVPKATFRQQHYEFNIPSDSRTDGKPIATPQTNRSYLRADLTSRMTFGRVFGDLKDAKSSRYKHEIQPELTLTATPFIDQPSHPFFGRNNSAPFTTRDSISNGDIASDSGLQFDFNDRIYDRNQVSLAITNKLVQKRWLSNEPEYRQIVLFRLAQSFDAYQADHGVEPKQPWSDVSGLLNVTLDNFYANSTFQYYPAQNVTNTYSRVRLFNDLGQFAQVALTQTYEITPGISSVNRDQRTEDYALSSGVVSEYLNVMARVVYNANDASGQKLVKSWGYITQVKPPGDCWRITFMQAQVPGGDTTFKLSFDYTFDGVQKPPLPAEALDTLGI